LDLVGAQMVAPDEAFASEYAAALRSQEERKLNKAGELLAKYIERSLAPSGGRRHRSLLLIFRGEDPCRKLSKICGSFFPEKQIVEVESISGETIRDTYADLIFDPDNPEKVAYFEPAILTPRRQILADENLALFARYFRDSENIPCAMIHPAASAVERTLVILKPDNWNFASSRPGAIIDMFSRTGLRIVGIKIFHFSLNQALEFYGPVEAVLKDKLAPMFEQKAKEVLEKEFSMSINHDTWNELSSNFGQRCAGDQFLKIVEFMSGLRPDTCPPGEENQPGAVKCMIIIYEGQDAVRKIRDVLGPTDPVKAPGGTVRREFGSSIMVNTAHASDSTESYEREKDIVRVNENSLVSVLDEYLAKKQ